MSELSKQERAAAIASLGLTVESVFVPLSQSRNKAEKHATLNWKVTVKRNGRDVLTTDYSAGSAHAPSYRAPHFGKRTVDDADRDAMVAWECEHGAKAQGVHHGRDREGYGGKPGTLKPDALDVLSSLAMDSDVIDAGGFEEWAGNFGYDVDSRKAEAIYRACLETALKLRAALGDDGLAALRNAFEGY